MLLCRLDSAALLQGNISVHTQLPSSSLGVHPECINLAELCSFQEKVFFTLKVHFCHSLTKFRYIPCSLDNQTQSQRPSAMHQASLKCTHCCSRCCLERLRVRAALGLLGLPFLGVDGRRERGGGRKQKERGRRMEGTWEDGRWSEKGEGVSVTELIFDSLHILTALPDVQGALACVPRSCISHTGTVQGSWKPTEHPSRQPLTSVSKSLFPFNCFFFFTIQAALTKMAEKSASQFHLSSPWPA